MNTFDKKVAVVTGASSGIGRETVLSLIKAGYQVHAGARRLDAMRELENAGAYLHHVDLTNSENIDAFVTEVLKLSGRVDVLVNNAGYGAYGAVEDIPLSAAREQMEVNLFALAHLIKAVLPTMRKQRSGRIINVSSIGGKIWSPLGGWYHASKFAVEGLSDALRNELRPFGIDVIVIEPGGVKTEWTSIMLDNMKKNSGSGPYRAIVYAWVKASSTEVGAANPADVARVISRAVTSSRPKPRYVAPTHARIFLFLRWVLSDRAFDWLFGKIFRLPARIS
jgi:NAD(P)-dependent dehydrogenase (short-subunit alcohol dehydrogenase family)